MIEVIDRAIVVHPLHMTDFDEALRAAQNGDSQALDAFFSQWRPLLLMQAAQHLGAGLQARVDPADVVQEGMAQASCDIGAFRGQTPQQLLAWLQTLVVGHAAKVRRHHYSQQRSVRSEVSLAETMHLDTGPRPEQGLMDGEQAARVAAAIGELPVDMQEAIMRRVFFRQPWSEVAQALGKSNGAARSMWTRAIQILRQTLDDGEDDTEK